MQLSIAWHVHIKFAVHMVLVSKVNDVDSSVGHLAREASALSNSNSAGNVFS